MRTLLELIRIISAHKAISINDFKSKTDSSSKLYKLYKGLLDNKFSDDKTASEYLFPNAKSNSQYIRLKDKLKRKLINKSFFIDTNSPRFNSYQKAHQSCHRDWASIKILLAREGRSAGIELAEKLFKQASKFEFTEILLDISRVLRRHYGTVIGDHKKFEFYKKSAKQFLAIQQAEFDLEDFYESVILKYHNQKEAKINIYKLVQEKEKHFSEVIQKYDSYKLHYYYYLVLVIKYMSIHDYKKTIKVCEQGINFIENKPFQTKTSKATFLYQQLACYTQLKKYTEGNEIAKRCIQIKAKGTYSWFKALELNFILCLHTKKYPAAIDVFNQATQHSRFHFLNKNRKEIWLIFEAYLHYLINIKKVKLNLEEKTLLKKFRLGKFLNDVPEFSKDKRGMNIPILIFQIIYKLSSKDYDGIIERTEAIEKYSSRYLKKDDNYRSNCFSKMLLTIPKGNFHKVGIIRHTDKLYKNLLSVPLSVSRQAYEVEIIPYENLWEYVLENLNKKFH
jgi:hypothetical protein